MWKYDKNNNSYDGLYVFDIAFNMYKNTKQNKNEIVEFISQEIWL